MRVEHHPYLNVWVREDGCIYLPQSGTHKARWTFGFDNGHGYLQVGIGGKLFAATVLWPRITSGIYPKIARFTVSIAISETIVWRICELFLKVRIGVTHHTTTEWSLVVACIGMRTNGSTAVSRAPATSSPRARPTGASTSPTALIAGFLSKKQTRIF